MREKEKRAPSCLVIAPHPDDETIGAAMWMKRHGPEGLRLLHLTDGSPRDMIDASVAGFSSREEYAIARKQELQSATDLIGLSQENCCSFEFVDKDLYLHLHQLILRLGEMIAQLDPALVLSPAYEGGHPDHDAAAFAVAEVRRRKLTQFVHLEYRLYHADPYGNLITDDFLPYPPTKTEVLTLTPEEQKLKLSMIESFYTQREVLGRFHLDDERFREAPSYDFSRPPHPGTLLYEQWGWGITGDDWRRAAHEALHHLNAQ